MDYFNSCLDNFSLYSYPSKSSTGEATGTASSSSSFVGSSSLD